MHPTELKLGPTPPRPLDRTTLATLRTHAHTGSPRPHTLHRDSLNMFICSKHGQTGSGHTGFRLDGGEKTRGRDNTCSPFAGLWGTGSTICTRPPRLPRQRRQLAQWTTHTHTSYVALCAIHTAMSKHDTQIYFLLLVQALICMNVNMACM